ncbi:type II secretion system protein [Mucisphaera calidilacus]|uniref:Prepilin-type N-terminal cleavage/methylation domain-containing protein n=1 Tax=Mucisphaera calidilacus TaxID=2527982 RepID=A0A518BVA0_9BACT|nr:type II secretion system protein [Mucisphaera calidilacus]QDU70910.1 hypothetical protein Pan265_07530 [Mucisphaera calidilacus]
MTRHPCRTTGFTLIELLVVISIVALLMAILLPVLGSARDVARTALCGSNLRQAYLAIRTYADANNGYGPAIGQPYGQRPNWGMEVQARAGVQGSTPDELYSDNSVLVCPATAANSDAVMTRTYAMNATGHAGLPDDPDDYDNHSQPGHLRLDAATGRDTVPLLLDAAAAPRDPDLPPPTRTYSTIDFRQQDHREQRIGYVHASGERAQAVGIGGSVFTFHQVLMPEWAVPLP